MRREQLEKIVEKELAARLEWDPVSKRFVGVIAELLSASDARAIYKDAIRQVAAGSWRALPDASEAGKASGVPVIEFARAARNAGFDDDKIVRYRSYTGKGGYGQIELDDALQRLAWNEAHPDDQVPLKAGRVR